MAWVGVAYDGQQTFRGPVDTPTSPAGQWLAVNPSLVSTVTSVVNFSCNYDKYRGNIAYLSIQLFMVASLSQ